MTSLLDDLRDALAPGRAVVVAGAGVAAGACGSAPSWRGLLEDGIARCEELGRVPPGWAPVQHAQLGLDLESWLAVAEQVTLRLGGRDDGEFRRWLRESVGALAVDRPGLIEALVGLGVVVCTTNYDGLIEEVAGVDAVTWRDGPRALEVVRGDEQGIVHLHGFWREPASVVLGVRSYEQVLGDGSAQAMLKALATMRSLVLVGFGAGLEDPNFAALRSWMAETWPGAEHRHFRLVRESERAAALAEHAAGERIVPIVYGKDYSDLEPFLRGLAGAAPPQPAARPVAVSTSAVPAARPFFGREDLVERLVAAMIGVHPSPVPILGAPGIGKSALVLRCAHDTRVVARFGARRLWLRCDGAMTASAVVADLALALGLSEASAPAVLAKLGEEPTLLLLDNAETPWEADLTATEDLLGELDGVGDLALVCSFRGAQWPLGLTWNDALQVPPLPSVPAEQVFRAAAGDRFAGDPALPELLSDLDGMPIAIELLGRLAQAEPNLDGLRRRWATKRTDLLRARGGPDRHLSVAVSFDLSVANVSATARRLLALLALLADGVACDDLDAVFEEGEEVFAELRRAGLAFDEAERVRVLKPIRDHVALHHPVVAADAERAEARYVAFARQLGPTVGGKGGSDAAARLMAESANLTWAITAALARDPAADGIDAALALTEPGRFMGMPVDHLTQRALERARAAGDLRREAKAHHYLGLLTFARSDLAAASEHVEHALRLYRELGDLLGEANCIQSLGDIALDRAELDTARERYEEALTPYRTLGEVLGEANCIHSLGDIALRRSQFDTACERFERALVGYRRVGALLGAANCIYSLGDIAVRRSSLDAAREYLGEALKLYETLAEPYSVGLAHLALADAAPHERELHREAARGAWLSIGRDDLIAEYLDDDQQSS